ncbi:TIGR02265 family protein [Archangium primigenium]|uniref:TIGR02265 family protein n=1 Tax=[Archangium] primigenium TaxID=2792470 RepID=UPI00195ECB47|nr:TIGR02265 family protein [Archangium primigenium]MBM7113636.1 TIGR02265 family protein [Archangium primigenium]
MVVGLGARTGWEKTDGWQGELERRICLSSPDHTLKGLFLNGTMDVLHALGEHDLARRCLTDSGETRFLDFFNYPVAMHYRMVATALPVLAEAYGGSEEALRQLGRLVGHRFLRLGAGKVMLSLRPLSPRQLQSTLPVAWRTSVSFGEYAVRWMGPQCGRLISRHDFMPYPFHEGVMQTSLELWGGRSVRVSGRQTGGLDSECDFWWQ